MALAICTYIASTAFVAAGLAIVFNQKSRTVSLVLGAVLLLIFCFAQVPYELLIDYYKHLGSWTSALKELAIGGGAFVVAGSIPINGGNGGNEKRRNILTSLLEKIVLLGSIFFCITMVLFGIDHFLYTDFCASLVPNWIPGHIFWTYFAGVALIGSGIAIILKIKLRLIAMLLGVMIFLWFILLHIPRAIADPYGLQGNEISSVLESLGFSGVAFLIAYGYGSRKPA